MRVRLRHREIDINDVPACKGGWGAMMPYAFFSPGDLIIIFIVALLLFGPNRMPDIARQMARAVREFRKISGDVTDSIMNIRDDVEGSAKPVKDALANAAGSVKSEIDSVVKSVPVLSAAPDAKSSAPTEQNVEHSHHNEQTETKEKTK
jgi:TatA/E family protein of Tat protein translocase